MRIKKEPYKSKISRLDNYATVKSQLLDFLTSKVGLVKLQFKVFN